MSEEVWKIKASEIQDLLLYNFFKWYFKLIYYLVCFIGKMNIPILSLNYN